MGRQLSIWHLFARFRARVNRVQQLHEGQRLGGRDIGRLGTANRAGKIADLRVEITVAVFHKFTRGIVAFRVDGTQQPARPRTFLALGQRSGFHLNGAIRTL